MDALRMDGSLEKVGRRYRAVARLFEGGRLIRVIESEDTWRRPREALRKSRWLQSELLVEAGRILLEHYRRMAVEEGSYA